MEVGAKSQWDGNVPREDRATLAVKQIPQNENVPPSPRHTAPRPSPRMGKISAQAAPFSFSSVKSSSPMQTPKRTPLRARAPPSPMGSLAQSTAKTPKRLRDSAKTPGRPAKTPGRATKTPGRLLDAARTPGRIRDICRTPGGRARSGTVSALRTSSAISVSDYIAPETGGDNVKVCIRVRPLNDRELDIVGGRVCAAVSGTQQLSLQAHPEPHVYTFDHVAGQSSTQEDIFQMAGRPVVSNCMDGYNSCIFAYGQTGSGKTHTMLGMLPDAEGETAHPEAGLMVRVFQNLFASINHQEQLKGRDRVKYICKCSMIEIYNETIFDLLNPAQTQCHIREDIKSGVHMVGQTEEDVFSVMDVVRILQQGTTNRHVGETRMNRESSRSHCVLTCVLESKTTEDDGIVNIRHSRLNLVDLAGSERQKSTGAAGERLKEASNINKSLSVLGLVIMSLVEAQHGRQRHIPYRDSRLTFLLQDSLGGNSKTVMIANISPATANFAETVSTLRFAQRAKRIKNKAVINENSTGDAAILRKEIYRLRAELAGYQSQKVSSSLSPFALRSSLEAQCALSDVSPITATLGAAARSEDLMSSLRREAVAQKEIKLLKAEVMQVKQVAAAKDKDCRKMNMIIRLREGKIKRLEGKEMQPASVELEELREELTAWKEKAEHHPEVTRFAMENLQLRQSLAELQQFVEPGGERDTLLGEITCLRDKTIRLVEEASNRQQIEKVKAELQSALAERDAASRALELVRSEAEATRRADSEVEAQLHAQLAEASKQTEEAREAADKLQEELWELNIVLEDRDIELLEAKVMLDNSSRRSQEEQEELQSLIQEQLAELECLRAGMAAIEAEKGHLYSEKLRLEGAFGESSGALDDLRSELARMSCELEEKAVLEAGISHAEQCADTMRAELNWIMKEIEFQRFEADARMTEATEAEKRASDAEAQARAMLERLSDLAGEQFSSPSSSPVFSRANSVISMVEGRVCRLQENLHDAQEVISLADQRQEELEQEIEVCYLEIQDLREEADQALEIHNVEKQLADAEDLVSQMSEELVECTQELEFLRAEADGQKAAARAAHMRASDAESVALKLMDSMSEVCSTSEGGAAAPASADNLGKEAERLSSLLRQHNKAAVERTTQLEHLHQELIMRSATIESLEKEVKELVEKGVADHSGRLQRAEEKAAQMEKELDVARVVADNLRAREKEAEAELEKQRSDLTDLQQRLTSAEERVKSLSKELQVSKEREDDLEELIAALEEDRPAATPAKRAEAAARQRLEHLQRDLEREQATNDEVGKQLHAKSQQLEQLRTELAYLKERQVGLVVDTGRTAELEKELEDLKLSAIKHEAAARNAANDAVRMAEATEDLRYELLSVKAKSVTAEQRAVKLESELTRVNGQQNLQNRIHHMQKVKDENSALRAELAFVRDEFRRLQHRQGQLELELGQPAAHAQRPQGQKHRH